jgi:hypothetical protein
MAIDALNQSPRASRSPELAELLRTAINYHLDDLHVMLPGSVQLYDPTSQTANIQPLIKRRVKCADGTELLETLPVLVKVPIVFPRGGGTPGFFITFPIQPGDYVMLVFAERSLDVWLADPTADSTNPVDPGEFRKHDISDAVAIPGLYPFLSPLTDASPVNMAMGKSGGPQIHVTPADVRLGSAAATKGVARNTDPVSVTVPAGTFLTAAAGGGTFNATDVTLTGTITAGSIKIKADD